MADTPPEKQETPAEPNVDALFNELDQGFTEKLNDIKSELATIEAPPALESFALSAEYLKEGGAKDEDVEPNLEPLAAHEPQTPLQVLKEGGFLGALALVALKMITLPVSLIFSLVLHVARTKNKSKKEALKEYLPLARSKGALVLADIKDLGGYLRGIQYARLFAIIVLLVGIVSLVVDIRKNVKSADKTKDPFLSSYNTVADSVETMPDEDAKGESESVLQHPEFTVKLPRIISNLKPPSPRATPMISTELYIEASNQEAAVEIHDREREVRDVIERVFEESTFEALDTPAGKEDLKVRLRNSLNRILNRGRVKRLYFSALNIAP